MRVAFFVLYTTIALLAGAIFHKPIIRMCDKVVLHGKKA